MLSRVPANLLSTCFRRDPSSIAGSLLRCQGWWRLGRASAENLSVPLEIPAWPTLAQGT